MSVVTLDVQAMGSDVAKTRDAILGFFEKQANNPNSAVLSGQNCGHGNKSKEGYKELVEDLVSTGSPRIALVGVDYGLDKNFDAQKTNAALISHWKKGGLVTVSWHASNPWTKGTSWDTSDANLLELLEPTSIAFKRWRADLDKVAVALKQLRDAGVVVLWRPLHEMNGNWFWWGMLSHPNDPSPYRKLWLQMYKILTYEYSLDNLIWIYSVCPQKGPSWTQPVDYYFPGSDMVDMVGVDLYANIIKLPDYSALKRLGKPIALTEFGPGHALRGGGEYDNRNTIEELSTNYPEIVYWLQWHDWQSKGKWVRKSIRHNLRAIELLNDPRVLNVNDLEHRYNKD